jgi:hypothetical protein
MKCRVTIYNDLKRMLSRINGKDIDAVPVTWEKGILEALQDQLWLLTSVVDQRRKIVSA